MSAFGVVMVGLGVLMIWSGVKKQKLNTVLQDFLKNPSAPKGASTAAATTTTGTVPQGVITV